MDKNAIKKYAVWARRELISRVTQRALKYGISENEIIPAKETSIHGVALSPTEITQRTALIVHINNKGFEQVMEEVAYTWFNRFSALRFMEVNGYLPTHVRVFTDDENNFKPQIMAEAINLEMDGLDMEKVYAMKDANDNDALFKYLIITQCNALSSILPGMFQKIDDYTELLFPDNLLREGSAIEQMIICIPEDDWKDQVQIIGWLYQYYNTEPKDKVFADLKKNIKISKENIPAATQLFTPDWIVRYMVENSLGRLWLEGHPNIAEQLLPTKEEQEKYVAGDRNKDDHKWHYYLEEAEQEPDVQAQIDDIRKEYASLKPEDIKCIDPCSGSGHILAYMFDVLVQIYESYGYTSHESVASIVENNIYGLDIDDRAAQLAYFSVMMKARQYDRRFFSRGIQPHVYSIRESNGLDQYVVEYLCDSRSELQQAMKTLMDEMYDGKEYGSILKVTRVNFDEIYARFEEIRNEVSIYRESILRDLLPIVQVASTLAQKYHVVVTNPPYMGINGMGVNLSKFVKHEYPDTKSDMSTVFMQRALEMSKHNGYVGMINIPVWMFLASYEKLRRILINNKLFINLLHLGRGVFGADFGTTAFVVRNENINNYLSCFRKLYIRQGSVDDNEKKIELFMNGFGQHYIKQQRFLSVPNNCIAYSASDSLLKVFEIGKRIDSYAEPKQGIATADNDRFLRLWYEVDKTSISVSCQSHEEAENNNKTWFPYNKGGGFKKWYGNNEYIINWKNDGFELRNFKKSVIRSPQFYFRECLSWCKVTISGFSMRYIPSGFLFDVAGCSLFVNNYRLYYILGFANSKINSLILSIISPTVNYEVGHIASLPLIEGEDVERVEKIVQDCINFSIYDWDAFETSWDFQQHPLIRNSAFSIQEMKEDGEYHITDMNYIQDAFTSWDNECYRRFCKLKYNEEELNRIFINIYGLQNEVTPEVDDKDITVRRADLKRDIKSLISFAVGCMFGRYSLDKEGLIFAGGEWDSENYKSFPADKDNIIPISDDEYFEDDIANRFVDFIRTVYGEQTLDENLKFIADALGGKGHPKEVIRNYFLNDFYADHLKIYQKRPIYWLFDSGKKNGFKCLIYMHRYQPDTIARIRTDYVHEQQSRYRTSIADLEKRVASASTSEKVKLTKQLSKLQDQAAELHEYEEKIHHLADQYISIDLDDGVKVNYAKFQDVLAKIK